MLKRLGRLLKESFRQGKGRTNIVIILGAAFNYTSCLLKKKSNNATVGFLLLQCSSGVVRHPRDLQVSVATRSCRVLIFASS